MDPKEPVCNCEWCETQRKEQGHDPYFNDRNEHDMMQESAMFPWLDDPSDDLAFDGDILDYL